MKQFLILILFPAISFGQKAKGFHIKGKFGNAVGQKIYLIKRGESHYSYEKTVYLDSAIIKNDTFSFRGYLVEPDYYSILFKNDWRPFILDNSIVFFSGDANEYLSKSKIYGSKEIIWADELKKNIRLSTLAMNNMADSSMSAEGRGDSALARIYADSNQYYFNQIKSANQYFISKYPNSFISLTTLNNCNKDFGVNVSKKLFNKLSSNLKKHSIGKGLRYKIFDAEQMIALNKKAVQFSQADTSGKKIQLSSFKGKYLLIDFWASWCGPCRAENPNLKEMYAVFKPKGLEILGVSLDNDITDWTKALIKDDLPWINVSDLNGWQNEAAKKYLVTAVPANFLLDKEGKIIAKNLKGDALMQKLTELLGL